MLAQVRRVHLEDTALSLRKRFETDCTLGARWRLGQLRALRKMLVDNNDLFCRALSEDLGKSNDESNHTEVVVWQIFRQLHKQRRRFSLQPPFGHLSKSQRKLPSSSCPPFPCLLPHFLISLPLSPSLFSLCEQLLQLLGEIDEAIACLHAWMSPRAWHPLLGQHGWHHMHNQGANGRCPDHLRVELPPLPPPQPPRWCHQCRKCRLPQALRVCPSDCKRDSAARRQVPRSWVL